MARPARAVRATIRSCGNREDPSPVPVVPNQSRFSAVPARFTSIPSAASAGMPATMTADGSPSPIRAPAACQKISCMISGGISSRHSPMLLPVGTCQPKVNGTSDRSPATVRIASTYEEPGSRVIAMTRRMTSG